MKTVEAKVIIHAVGAIEEYTQQQKKIICYALGTLYKSIVKLFNNMKGNNDAQTFW